MDKLLIGLTALIGVGVLLIGVSAFSLLSQPRFDVGQSGQLLQTRSNQQFFEQQAASSGSQCGNLQDVANVQHLSHHPGQYADCLKKVDPAFLQKATGKTIEQILGSA